MSNYSIFISIFCIFIGIINIAVHASEDDSVQESLIGILCVVAGSFGLVLLDLVLSFLGFKRM